MIVQAIRIVGTTLRLSVSVAGSCAAIGEATSAVPTAVTTTMTTSVSDEHKKRLDGAYVPPHLRASVAEVKASANAGDIAQKPTLHARKGGRRSVTIVKHVEGSEHIEASPSDTVVKTWRLRNDATELTVPAGAKLVLVSKHTAVRLVSFADVPALAPAETADVSCTLLAPHLPGVYKAFLRLAHASLGRFGPRLPVTITVVTTSDSSAAEAAAVAGDAVAESARSHRGRHGHSRRATGADTTTAAAIGTPGTTAAGAVFPPLTEEELEALRSCAEPLTLHPVFVARIMADPASAFRLGLASAIKTLSCAASLAAHELPDQTWERLLRAPWWERRVQGKAAKLAARRAGKGGAESAGCGRRHRHHVSGDARASAVVGFVSEKEDEDDYEEADVASADDGEASPDATDGEAAATAVPVTMAELRAELAAARDAVAACKEQRQTAIANADAARAAVAEAKAAAHAAGAARSSANKMLAAARTAATLARGRVTGFKAASRKGKE